MALQDEVSAEAMKRLEAFSHVANRGDLHPNDSRRGRAFIIQAHLDDAPIGDGPVTDWLDAKGWNHDKAVRLGADYYDSRYLLKEYDEERGEGE